jgi:peptidoglycan hydrolase-like protein with peptidoglycan-binding domain
MDAVDLSSAAPGADAAAAAAETPPPIPAQPPVLRPGARGVAVVSLQRSLNDWLAIKGWSQIEADGTYGPSAVSSVKDFQKAKGLTADGVVGPGTWKALAAEISPIATPAPTGVFSPAGTYALSGDDPAHGSMTGEVAIARLPDNEHVRVRYSVSYADGSQGTITGIGRIASRFLSFETPIASAGGTGVFAPDRSPKDTTFNIDYEFDPRLGSAKGSSYFSVSGNMGPKATEGIARPSPGTAAIADAATSVAARGAAGAADVIRAADPLVSNVFTAASAPLGAFSDLELPTAPGLTFTNPGDNRIHASVELADGQTPKVSVWFDQPLTVKGGFPIPDAQVSSIWFDGDRIQTDAHFAAPILDMIPGISAMPDQLAQDIAGRTGAGFAPLVQLLHARAQAGELPDADALGRALVGTVDSPPPEGLVPMVPFIDKSQVGGVADLVLKRELSAPGPDGGTIVAHEGTKVHAELPLDLDAGTPGELALTFDPPIHLKSDDLATTLAMPSVQAMRIAPDGRIALETGSFMHLFDETVAREAGPEARRMEAFLRVLYQEIPADSDLGKALRRAGVSPR